MTTNQEFTLGHEDKLEDALALLAAGFPLETVLSEAGDDAEWLHPLLEIAGEVGELRQVIPVPSPDASLQKLLAHGEQLAKNVPPANSASPGWQTALSNLFRGSFRLATGLATALLVVILVGGMLNLAAQNSLPGQTLYQLKRASEAIQLDLTGDPSQREQLMETFNQRRLLETQSLLEQDQEAQVTFENLVRSVSSTSIEFDGLLAQITPDTEIKGQLMVGARVQVEAITRPPDSLIALTITVIETPPSPTPSPTPTLTPTATMQPTATPTATQPKVQTVDTLEPTATLPKAQATDTLDLPPTPTPSQTPTNDNTDDNLDDIGNDNQDDFDDNSADDFNDDENDDFNGNEDDNFDNGDDFDDNDPGNDSEDDGSDNQNGDEEGNDGSGNSGSGGGDEHNDDQSDDEDNSGEGSSDDGDDGDEDEEK